VLMAQHPEIIPVSIEDFQLKLSQSRLSSDDPSSTDEVMLLQWRDSRDAAQTTGNRMLLGGGWMASTFSDIVANGWHLDIRIQQLGFLKPSSKLSSGFNFEADIRDLWESGARFRSELFFFGISKDEMLSKLNKAGVEVWNVHPRLNAIRIYATSAEIRTLSNWSNVMYLSPITDSRTPLANLALTMNRVNKVHDSTSGGLNLKGKGIKIGVWDFGPAGNHLDYQSGVHNVENDFFNVTGSTHTSLVTGAIVGRGVVRQDIVGMAPDADVFVYNFFGDIIDEMRQAYDQSGVKVANHSYNLGAAFNCDALYSYDANSALMDDLALEKPDFLQVLAAGNSAGPCPYDYVNIVPGYQYSKNVLTVGNLQNNETLYPGSAKGPTTDGRLKPDICTKGASTFTPTATGILLPGINQNYTAGFGTSFSSPQVAGIAGLIQEAAIEMAKPEPSAPLLKGLLCNTAQDLGNPGPDYEYGYGRVNAYKAITAFQSGWYKEDVVAHGQTKHFNIDVPAGVGELKVMLVWHDPASNLPAAKILSNDLDIVLSYGANSWRPWKLDPGQPALAAIRGRDSLNNSEQVTLSSPSPGTYTVSVSGYEVVSGSQPFVITWSWDQIGAKLSYPSGGEVLARGAPVSIRWEAVAINEILEVEWSPDAGITWQLIGSAEAALGALPWTVPAVFSDKALIRLRSGDAIWAVSDTVFAIMGRPVIASILRCNSGLRFSWASIEGANAYVVSRYENEQWIDEDTLTALIFQKRNAVQGLDYTYAVRPLFNGKSGPRSNASFITPRPAACSFPGSDIGITSIRPISGRLNTSSALTTAEYIKIRYQNYSNTLANYTITMYWQVNGGNVDSSTFALSVPANSSAWFTSNNTFDFSQEGEYVIKAWLKSTSDAFRINDTMEVHIRQIGNEPYKLPYYQDFESVIAHYSDSTIGLQGLQAFDFMPTGNGRARFGGAQFFAPEGKSAVTLDNFADNNSAGIANLLLTLNLTDYIDSLVYFDFQYRSRGEAAGNDFVFVRGADTNTWIAVYDLYSQAPSAGISKQTKRFNISQKLLQNGQQFSSSTQILASVDAGRAASSINTVGGYTLDDYSLFSPGKDVELLSVNFQPSICTDLVGADSLELTVSVKNHYIAALNDIPVYFGTADTSFQLGQVNIPAFDSVTQTFKIGFLFDTTYSLNFSVWAAADGDHFPDNDSITKLNVVGLKILHLPYLNGFETDDQQRVWVSAGLNPSWELGYPQKSLMYAPADGENAWVTRLSSNYNLFESSQLYIGCLESSALSSGALIAFHHILQTEAGFDYVSLEFSQDGKNWQPLGVKGSGFNWFNQVSGYPSWQGERPFWQSASYPISPDSFPNQNDIQLRFTFSSDEIITLEGFALDDWRILPTVNAIARTEDSIFVANSNGNGEVFFTTQGGKIVAVLDDGGESLGELTLQMKTSSCLPNLNGSLVWPRTFYFQSEQPVVQPVAFKVFVPHTEYALLVNADSTVRSMREIGVLQYKGTQVDINWNNNATANYAFTAADSVRFLPYTNGYEVDFKLSCSNCEFYLSSNETAQVFSVQPKDASACYRSFTAIASISNPVYQWQRKSDDQWVDILPANTDFSGAQTSQLNIINHPAFYDGQQFRCIVSNAQICSLSSDSAVYLLQPQPILVAEGNWLGEVACDYNEWTYYASSSDPGMYFLAIKWAPDGTLSTQNAVAKQDATIHLKVDPSIFSAIDLSGDDPLATFSMRRYWNVDIGANVLDEPVELKFYYDHIEKQSVIESAINFISMNGGSNEGFSWFKTESAAFDPLLQVKPANVVDAVVLVDSNTTLQTEAGVLFARFTGIYGFSGGTGVSGVGPFNDPLPVELLYFKAVCNKEMVLLSWATASEENSAFFEVQRAGEDLKFYPIAKVAAAGESRATKVYEWEDHFTESQMRYYRLRQVDLDGTEMFSQMIMSSCSPDVDNYQLQYDQGIVRIRAVSSRNKRVAVNVIDAAGKQMDAFIWEIPKGVDWLSYPSKHLPGGTYFFQLLENSGSTALKVVIY
jgi:hypothetical protein